MKPRTLLEVDRDLFSDHDGELGSVLRRSLMGQDADSMVWRLRNEYGISILAGREENDPYTFADPVPGFPAVYNELRNVTILLFQRYIDRINALPTERMDYDGPKSFAHLRWMCETSIKEIDEHPVDKLHRWLGFVQAGLFWKDALDVDEERNFSRPFFHKVYVAMGLRPPATRERI